MGPCFSVYTEPSTKSTAKVITINGSLREFSVEVPVSQVLESESAQSSYFVCNSDKLYYDEFIQDLDLNEELQMGQIYFILPLSGLQSRLTANDMAGLAVKASTAISKSSKRGGRRRNFRVLPVLEVDESFNEERFDGIKRFDQRSTTMLTRSGSVRKLQRNASKRAKMTVQSFRLRLNTIHEGSIVE